MKEKPPSSNVVAVVWRFVTHWYFRYLLVTELYMVEKWERVMIHIVILIFLLGLSMFNTQVVLRFVDLVLIPPLEIHRVSMASVQDGLG